MHQNSSFIENKLFTKVYRTSKQHKLDNLKHKSNKADRALLNQVRWRKNLKQSTQVNLGKHPVATLSHATFKHKHQFETTTTIGFGLDLMMSLPVFKFLTKLIYGSKHKILESNTAFPCPFSLSHTSVYLLYICPNWNKS